MIRHRRPVIQTFLILALLVALAPAAHAANVNVTVGPDLAFHPSTVTIQAGDTVTWTLASGFHNVAADDGSFRCADGCDGAGGNGDPNGNPWHATHAFTETGQVGYHCEVHGSVGMTGKVIVQGGSNPPPSQGTLALSPSAYNASAAGGTVTVTVTRTGGDDGAVSVAYSAVAGTAVAGTDFTPVSGTLNWADHDDSSKSFAVPILAHTTSAANKTVTLHLASATGGATLGASSGTITIKPTGGTNPPPTSAGTLQFTSSGFSGAANGPATITVSRVGGTSGAVAASYSTSAGTATAGVDFTPASGTVSFANGDGAAKTFTVALLGTNGVKSLDLHLSNPTGGATLGVQSSASLVILGTSGGDVSTLSADEVVCDESRLAGLLARFNVTSPHSAKKNGINLSLTSTGDFAGIAYTGSGPGTAEHQLAFSTNPEETTLLRNPARPQLFSISLTRNDLNSDLVGNGDADQLSVLLNPTTNVTNPAAATLLSINNVSLPAGLPASAQPGRGLGSLLTVCHGTLSDRDVNVLHVLTKLARAVVSTPKASIAIFRGEAANSYRIDVIPVDASNTPQGRLAVQLDAVFSGNALNSGTLHILPRCAGTDTGDCTNSGAAELDLIRPVASGFPSATPYKVSTNGAQGDGTPSVSVDFQDLLNGTTWQAPL